MRRLSCALAFGLLLTAAPAAAHGAENHWTLAPAVTIPLALAALLYAVGLARLWRRAALGRLALARAAA